MQESTPLLQPNRHSNHLNTHLHGVPLQHWSLKLWQLSVHFVIKTTGHRPVHWWLLLKPERKFSGNLEDATCVYKRDTSVDNVIHLLFVTSVAACTTPAYAPTQTQVMLNHPNLLILIHTSSLSPDSHPTRNTSTIYVDAHTPILLQTERLNFCDTKCSAASVDARAIMDTGSQRTYVTSIVNHNLWLPISKIESLYIKTFVSIEGQDTICETVELELLLKNGEMMRIQALVVPVICNPFTLYITTYIPDQGDLWSPDRPRISWLGQCRR